MVHSEHLEVSDVQLCHSGPHGVSPSNTFIGILLYVYITVFMPQSSLLGLFVLVAMSINHRIQVLYLLYSDNPSMLIPARPCL